MGTYPECSTLVCALEQHFGAVCETDVRLEHFHLDSKNGIFLHYARAPATSAQIIEKDIVFAFVRSKLSIKDLTAVIRHQDYNQSLHLEKRM